MKSFNNVYITEELIDGLVYFTIDYITEYKRKNIVEVVAINTPKLYKILNIEYISDLLNKVFYELDIDEDNLDQINIFSQYIRQIIRDSLI